VRTGGRRKGRGTFSMGSRGIDIKTCRGLRSIAEACPRPLLYLGDSGSWDLQKFEDFSVGRVRVRGHKSVKLTVNLSSRPMLFHQCC